MLQTIFTDSPVIVGVFAILVIFSIGSWAVIIQKLVQLGFLKRNTREFTELFWEVKEFSAVEARLAGLKPGPLAALFREGYRETRHFLALSAYPASSGALTAEAGGIENISRSLRKVSSREIAKIERDVGFLATAGATTPFIGLFGTVWGIMSAFQSIGQAGLDLSCNRCPRDLGGPRDHSRRACRGHTCGHWLQLRPGPDQAHGERDRQLQL